MQSRRRRSGGGLCDASNRTGARGLRDSSNCAEVEGLCVAWNRAKGGGLHDCCVRACLVAHRVGAMKNDEIVREWAQNFGSVIGSPLRESLGTSGYY